MKHMIEVPRLMFGAIVAAGIVLFLALTWSCWQLNQDADDYMKVRDQMHEIGKERDFALQRLDERMKHCR